MMNKSEVKVLIFIVQGIQKEFYGPDIFVQLNAD